MALTFGVLGTYRPGWSSEDFIRLARLAEDLGYDRYWVADSPMIWYEVYVGLTMLALNTRRISLGTGVTHPIVRHPAITASAIGTLNEVSGGRMVLGIGAGDSGHGTVGIKPADSSVVKDTIQLIRNLHLGREVEHQGHPLQLLWSQQQIPIYWATSARSSLALAGEVADGVILAAPVESTILREMVEVVRRAASDSGRDPADVKVCLWTNCYVATSKQEIEKARFETRATATSRLRHSRWWLTHELKERAERIRSTYKFYDHTDYHSRQYEQTGADVVDMMAIIGSPEECISRLEMCVEAGVDELMLGMHYEKRIELLERLAKEVMPRFNK